MSRKPERELRILANKTTGLIEIVLLADGSQVGSVSFTQDQAEHHARLLITAIEMVNEGKPKLFMPDGSRAPAAH